MVVVDMILQVEDLVARPVLHDAPSAILARAGGSGTNLLDAAWTGEAETVGVALHAGRDGLITAGSGELHAGSGEEGCDQRAVAELESIQLLWDPRQEGGLTLQCLEQVLNGFILGGKAKPNEGS